MPAETPQEFGEELRRERELRDVSREQISAATKVSVRQLEALESGRFELLPAAVFTRGFVRSIALHLGLDAERAVAAFGHVHSAWATDQAAKRPLTISGPTLRLSKPRRTLASSTTVLGLGVALFLALVTGTTAFVRSRSLERAGGGTASPTPPERVESGPASLALPAAIAAATVALPPDESATVRTERVSPPERGRTLTLTFRDDCWTEVSVDGKVVAAELFRKGATREFTGAQKFTLTLGNAGGVDVTLDGKSLQSIGLQGQVVRDFVIDEQTQPRPAIKG